MVLYSDSQFASITDANTELTPAHIYTSHDFESILIAIQKGEIPSGSGQVFPVNWQTEDDGDKPNWSSINQSGFRNPLAQFL